jgi:lipopolysaccharide transport system ATP-binding protein
VGGFIDTPVKRYSSGMYVRLAFAVAAHLEPDILIVDEVLAVGDARFQRKCLGKMQEISTTHGRTVLYVSHNLESVQRLCSHCLLLDRGRLRSYGATRSVVAEYLGADLPSTAAEKWIDLSKAGREGTGEARFAELWFTSHSELSAGQPYSDGPVEIALAINARAPKRVQSIAICFCDQLGKKLVNADTGSLGQTIELPEGRTIVRLRIEQLHLKPGIYGLALWMARYAGERISGSDILDFVAKAVEIEVVELTSPGFRVAIGGDEVVTCDFKVVDISHPQVPGG